MAKREGKKGNPLSNAVVSKTRDGAVIVDFTGKASEKAKKTVRKEKPVSAQLSQQCNQSAEAFVPDYAVSAQNSENGKGKGRYPWFDMEKVLELYRSGDPEKKEKAVEMTYLRYRKYVASLAHGYFGSFFKSPGEHFVSGEDFLSAGNLGLIEGLEHFDPEKGSFTTCCKPYVLKYMTEQACLGSDIPTPHYMNVQKKLKRAIDSFQKVNVVPSVSRLSEATGLTERIVKDGLEMMRMIPAIPSGLCDYRSDETGFVVNPADDSDTPEETVLRKEFKTRIDDVMGRKLTVNAGEALRMRFGFYRDLPEKGLTFPEIARRLGVDSNKARATVQRALKSLKDDEEVMEIADRFLLSDTKKDIALDMLLPVSTENNEDYTTPDADFIGSMLDDILSFDFDRTLLA